MKKVIIVLMVISPFMGVFAQSQPPLTRNLSVVQFQHALDSLQDEILIDLRTPDEVKNGIIANAVQIDFFGKEFEQKLASLDKKKVYLIYCASGGRSGETVGIMSEMGFHTIYDLKDGFRGWVRQKMPISKLQN